VLALAIGAWPSVIAVAVVMAAVVYPVADTARTARVG
jgi:hypothetical protein